ncbi:MAG: hypothetical protein H7A33_02330 [Deltaproteobacteria bacterium]|nr:hypothetical protein [Deltaproteobacteria bacterium]
MDIVKTGRNWTQTIKNVSRFKEIISVFARNGFDEFIIKANLHGKIPDFVVPSSRLQKRLEDYAEESWPKVLGYRLRECFEELGPSFIKFGQLLSTREDLFPEDFVKELRHLQDRVKGIPFDDALGVIQNSLDCDPGDIFSKIEEEPIGTASIGVVYKAQLKDGSDVVIKVRRPDISKLIRTDFSLLYFMVSRLEKVSDELRYLGLSRVVRDFGVSIETELDYQMEAMHGEQLRSAIKDRDSHDIFHLPKIYDEYSTDEILVMEYLDGIPFSDAEAVNKVKDIIHQKLELGIGTFVQNLLVDGVFHADLHGGNFFLLKDHKIGLVDFGSVGHLGKTSRAHLVAIMYSLINHDFENVVYEFLDVAEYDQVPDVDALVRDVRDVLTPYIGLTVQQMNVTQMFRAVTSTLVRHQVFLPREWFIVFRAMVALDGVGKSLKMDFDIFAIVRKDIMQIIQELSTKDRLIEEGVWLARDLITSFRSVPRHMRWAIKEIAKNNYAFKVEQQGYEKEIKAVAHSLRLISICLFSGLLIGCGTLFAVISDYQSWTDLPVFSWVFWALGLLYGGWNIRPKKRFK